MIKIKDTDISYKEKLLSKLKAEINKKINKNVISFCQAFILLREK